MKPTIGTIFYTLLSRFLLLLIFIVWAIPFLIIIITPRKWLYKNPLFYACTQMFYWVVLKLSFLPFTFKGRDNIPKEQAIYVANHQSSLDIPVVGYLLDRQPHVWMAKAELMDSWLLRFILPNIAVLVDMSTPSKGSRSLVKIIKLVRQWGLSVVIFPEGGRYVDGKVHDFFAGFAILAKKTGLPVVPIYIFDLHKVYPPDSFWIYYHPIKVVIGQPMHMQEDEGQRDFTNRVRNWFLEQE